VRQHFNPFAQPLTRHRRYVTAPRNWVPGEMVTSNMMNTIRDNLLEIEAGTADLQKSRFVGRTSVALALDLAPAGKAQLAYDTNLGSLVASLDGGPYDVIGGGSGLLGAYAIATGL
jgi:hypothetical protein